MSFSHLLRLVFEVEGAVIKYRTEGVEDFVKTSGPNILASKNSIPQQKSQHKISCANKINSCFSKTIKIKYDPFMIEIFLSIVTVLP